MKPVETRDMVATEFTGRDTETGAAIAVVVDDGVVRSVGPAGGDEEMWLSPGLIDLQVNGFRGYDVNSASPDATDIASLVDVQLREGVTTFAPTVVTASEERMIAALRAIASARAKRARAAHAIPFVHVEGPYFSSEDGPRGAHPLEHIRAPSLTEFERWQDASGGLVGLVTMSPHFLEAPAYIAELTSRGVHVAIGHTHAGRDAIMAAVAAGARLSTHLGNGAHSQLPRHPNYLWTQLAEDRLTATFIADGHHLPADTLVAMLRAKGTDRSILVSDSVNLGGLPAGIYKTPAGALVKANENGRLELLGMPYLAGATRSLNECVALATKLGRISLAQAIRMATVNPGRFAQGRGRIVPGAPADLVRFRWAPEDERLQIVSVIAAGEPVV
jgi:N-acetylglucosamine-6-phosphate deacetylase